MTTKFLHCYNHNMEKNKRDNIKITIFLILFMTYLGLSFPIKKYFFAQVEHGRGDPQYHLLTAYSILRDFDIDLRNNYLNRDFKSFYKGKIYHRFLEGKNGTWHPWYPFYSVGFALLLVPFCWMDIFVNKGAVFFTVFVMNLLMSISAVNVYSIFIKISKNTAISFVSVILVFLSLPISGYSTQIYPDVMAVFLISWVIRLYLTHDLTVFKILIFGIFIWVFPWLHIKFVLLDIILLFSFLYRFNAPIHRKYLYILILFFLSSILCLVLVNYNLYGYSLFPDNLLFKKNVFSLRYFIQGVLGQFFDQQIGLFMYSPFYIFVIPGFIKLFAKYSPDSIERKILKIIVAIFITSMIPNFHTAKEGNMVFPLWTGAFSIPPRYLVQVLPFLGVGIVGFIQECRGRNIASIIFNVLCAYSLIISFVFIIFLPDFLYKYPLDFEGGSHFLCAISPPWLDLRIMFPNLMDLEQPLINIGMSLVFLFLVAIFVRCCLERSYKKYLKFLSTGVLAYCIFVFLNLRGFSKVYGGFISASRFETRCGNDNGAVIASSGRCEHSPPFVFGPYLRLIRGNYVASFIIEAKCVSQDFVSAEPIVFEVMNPPESIYVRQVITPDVLRAYAGKKIEIPVFFKQLHPEKPLEFRIILNEPFADSLVFYGIELNRINNA